MTGHLPHELRLEMELRSQDPKSFTREFNTSTVRRVVVEQAICSLCGHTKPYKPGDEDRPCSACGSGRTNAWRHVDRPEEA